MGTEYSQYNILGLHVQISFCDSALAAQYFFYILKSKWKMGVKNCQ